MSRVGGPLPPHNFFLAIWGGLLATFLHYGGLFCYVFLFMGGLFHHVRGIFTIWEFFNCYFYLHRGAFFKLATPPPPTKMSAGVHVFGNGFQSSPLINSFQCILQYSKAIRTTVWCSLVCASHIISRSKIITIKLFNYISPCI